jgi:hypothetical protein
VEAGPSSQPEQSGSGSDAGPSTSQAGPSSTSNAAAAGRRSSFAQSTAGSEDSWDDMDCCTKCLDYFCVGPRADRERFRPWKKKSREVIEAEKQAKKEKRKGKARKHRTTKVNSQNVIHPLDHLHRQRDSTETGSLAYPTVDEADRQRIILDLQEQIRQLRRQLDDSKRKVGPERDRLDKNMEQFPHGGHESDRPQKPGLPTGTDNPAFQPLNCSRD